MIDNPIYKVDQCISEMKKFFPGYSISQIRSEVVGNETFGTSRYNGRDPFFIKLSNEYTPDMQGLKDIKIADRFVETVNEMTMAIMWNRYKMIYTIDTELAEALSKTKNLIFTRDIFEKIPYKGFFLNLSLLPEYNAEGCIVIISKNTRDHDMILVDIQLIGGRDVEEGDGTFEFLVFISSNGKHELKNNRTVTEGVFFDDEDGMFNVSTEEYIEASVKGEQALLKKTRAGYAINPENPYVFLPIRKKMVALELLVLQFLMYISSENPDIEMSRMTKKQKDRDKRLNKEKVPHSEPEHWNVGIRYGNKIRLYKKENEAADEENNESELPERGHHKPPRPHIRRAHWQYYWTGTGRTERKHKWIEPVLVNGKNEDVPITMIDVTDKESKGYDGENRIKEFLETKKVKFKHQYPVKSIQKRYDFCIFIHGIRLMIEFDGEQHFQPVEQWGGEEAYQKQKLVDKEKTEWCEKHRIPFLRIRYDQKPIINELVEDFIKNYRNYLVRHNKLLSMEEYYSICK